ncbi:MAG: hypothetical protein K2N58_10450 [Treponemataceae bacterium]|nr:hypothetical protein [Treponemataceae bacterium]
MAIIDTFLFYILFASAVLVYGGGMISVAEKSLSKENFAISIMESLSCVSATVALTFLIIRFLLSPLGIMDLYPLVALLIFVAMGVFFEMIVQVTASKSGADFAFPYLVIILSLGEGRDIVGCLMTSVAALASYYALVPILRALNGRNAMIKNNDAFKQRLRTFTCMVVLIFALYSLDISWLNVVLGK